MSWLRRKIPKINFSLTYRVTVLFLLLGLSLACLFNHLKIEAVNESENFIFPYDAFGQVEISIILERTLDGEVFIAQFSSSGSGSVVDIIDEESIVLTANHVCNPFEDSSSLQPSVSVRSKYLEVTSYYGETYHAEVLYSDSDYDLCLLRVEGLWATPVAISHSPAYVGERVYNMGAPSGFFAPGMVPLFDGYASGNIGRLGYQNSIYTIPTRGGSSGSPVLNSEGEIIGVIHSAIAEVENVAIACTWDELQDFMDRYEYLFKN